MRFDLDNAFGMHQQAMLVRAKRAEIIASNIANTDTPNYKARDIDFRAILKSKMQDTNRGEMLKTHPRHVDRNSSRSNDQLLYRNPSQPSVDGNTVDSQVEKAEFAQNSLQYQASVQFLSGVIKNLRLAIKGE